MYGDWRIGGRAAGLLLAACAALVGCDDGASTEPTADVAPAEDRGVADGASTGDAAPAGDAGPAPDAQPDGAAACEPGAVDGCWDETARRVCAGGDFAPDPCPLDTRCAEGECRPLVCAPGLPTCGGRRTPAVCNEDGTGWMPLDDCPAGAACRAGECVSECVLGGKDPSYIGCEYWSVDLDNYPDPFGNPAAVPHAVVLANPSASTANVRVTTQAAVQLPAEVIDVLPGEVRVYTFPRLDVDGTGITNHSFRLQSDWPVVAYQFNPLNNVGVFSNDASLLLPAEALGTEYFVMSWPTAPVPPQLGLPPQHGYFTVVATGQGSTEVVVVPSALVSAGPDLPQMEAGVEQRFTLEQYEVLNLQADGSNLFAINDLTGTSVRASQPVAVFGGHEEAVVGDGCCAEHLEEQLFPVDTWGDQYQAVQSEPRGGSQDLWRVLAAEDGTEVRTVPPQPGADFFTLQRGQWREIQTGDSFEIIADKPILVGQYLQSQEVTADYLGDPAMILAVPIIQYRDTYLVLTPAGYQEDWLTVVRPVGAEVRLDGVPLAPGGFRPFGFGAYEYAWIPVEDGPHVLEGDLPFGLMAHGYSTAVSYGYPAGLNLLTER